MPRPARTLDLAAGAALEAQARGAMTIQGGSTLADRLGADAIGRGLPCGRQNAWHHNNHGTLVGDHTRPDDGGEWGEGERDGGSRPPADGDGIGVVSGGTDAVPRGGAACWPGSVVSTQLSRPPTAWCQARLCGCSQATLQARSGRSRCEKATPPAAKTQ